jgi:hypothetical protein
MDRSKKILARHAREKRGVCLISEPATSYADLCRALLGRAPNCYESEDSAPRWLAEAGEAGIARAQRELASDKKYPELGTMHLHDAIGTWIGLWAAYTSADFS